MKTAYVAAPNETDDGDWHGTSRRGRGDFARILRGACPLMAIGNEARPILASRPPAEGITWGRK